MCILHKASDIHWSLVLEDVHSNDASMNEAYEDEEQDDAFQKTAEEAVLEGVDTTNVDELLQKVFFGFTPGNITKEIIVACKPLFIHPVH